MKIYKLHYLDRHEIRSFEKKLTIEEVKAIFDSPEINKKDGYLLVKTETEPNKARIKSLTFVGKIECPNDEIYTTQTYLNRLPKAGEAKGLKDLRKLKPKKREHNYVTHSLHSYKGKYYPQLVNGCINAYGNEPDIVLDIFTGSGTTNLESYLHGIQSIGVDLNPLACLIAETKIKALDEDTGQICQVLESFINQIKKKFPNLRLKGQRRLINYLEEDFEKENECISHEEILPEANLDYLKKWFDEKTLKEVTFLIREIMSVGDKITSDILMLSLSNIIRKISLQNTSQIRVNKLDSPPKDVDVLNKFLKQVKKRIQSLKSYETFSEKLNLGRAKYQIIQGDARNLTDIIHNKVSYIITSPPYAQAIPYIDMHRLSLFLFDLIQKEERKDFEWNMIGNREINKTQRKKLEEEFLEKNPDLPEDILKIIKKIHRLNKEANVGFRRKNKASLVYKYFKDMKESFKESYKLLDDRGKFTFVIGNNTTKAGGETVNIPNDKLLLKLAKFVGFEREDTINMTHQKAYRVHSSNKIDTESIITVVK